jgi:guanylate kinase
MGNAIPETHSSLNRPTNVGGQTGKPRGPLIVVSGPAGAGKTTVVERLLEHSRLPLRRAVTATTREVRPGELDGRDYHFWSPEQFRTACQEGRMLEWEIVHGTDFYGTPREEVDRYRADGTGVILVIDVKGAASIRALYPRDHLSIFLTAPPGALRDRLVTRGTDSEERIARRLKTAEDELSEASKFDCVITNVDLQQTVNELERVLTPRFSNLPAN